jgi:hypothetical protein
MNEWPKRSLLLLRAQFMRQVGESSIFYGRPKSR